MAWILCATADRVGQRECDCALAFKSVDKSFAPSLARADGRSDLADDTQLGRPVALKNFLIDLRALKEEQDFQLKLGRTPAPSDGKTANGRNLAQSATQAGAAPSAIAASAPVRRPWRAVAALATLVVLITAGWFFWRTSNVRWARSQLDQIAALAEAKRYFDAFDLAVRVEPYLPGDPTLAGLMPVISDTVSVTTTPGDASVHLTRFTRT